MKKLLSIYPDDSDQLLEFDKIVKMLETHCSSELGRINVNSMQISCDSEEIEEWLRQTTDFKDIIHNGLKFPQLNAQPLDEELDQLKIEGYVLNEHQFIKIQIFINIISSIYKFFKKHGKDYPYLYAIIEITPYEKEILAAIEKVFDEKGLIKNNASSELARIRRKINTKFNQLEKEFKKVILQYKKSGMLSDTLESIRNGRRVLSVQAEHKKRIGGILHDESDSGKVSFIEPAETVGLNNELFELEREEKREIYKILKDLTSKIRDYRDHLSAYCHILGQLDFIWAKAALAIKMDAFKPKLVAEREISLVNAKHPLLLLLNKELKKETVPLNLQMDSEKRILVISGPNAGGKSVCLKTVGLLQMMLQAGMLIPVEDQSKMHVFQNLFCDLGDAQSLEDELSTYSSRLKRMQHFLKHANSKTIFLIDEFGSGTDPSLGGAIAEAILDSLKKKKTFGVITTHYANLKIYADNNVNVFNGSMIFDESNLAPTYRLETGNPGSSYTFVIAEKSGLENDVIDKAKSLVDKGTVQFDKLLSNLKKETKALEKKNHELIAEDKKVKEMMRKSKTINEELEEQKKRLQYELKMIEQKDLQLSESKIRELIREIKAEKDQEKAAQKKLDELKSRSKEIKEDVKDLHTDLFSEVPKRDIREGDKVKILNSEKEGVVTELRKNKALVSFGNLKTQVSLKDLVLIDSGESTKPSDQGSIEVEEQPIIHEIDLRGCLQDEALNKLEYYLDHALLQNVDKVRIIHGRGTGALRKAVGIYLRKSSFVKSFEFADPKNGGDGVTIAEL